MKVGGGRRFAEVLPARWERFARHAGLSPPRVRRDLLAMAERLPIEARALADELRPSSSEAALSMFDRIVRDVEARAERVRRSFRSP